MVPKVECIYYLDGVWRVWMQCKMSWSVFQQSTFWYGKSSVRLIKWSKGYCLLCVHVIKITQTNHSFGMDFIFVSLQITVLFVYVFFVYVFFPVAIVWLCLHPVTVFVNATCKCYVMNYCKYSMSFLKINMDSMLASTFINPHMDLVCSIPHCYVRCLLMGSTQNLNLPPQKQLEIVSLLN